MTLPDGVTLRPAVPDDAEALTTLHHACWDEAYGDLVAPAYLARWKGDRAGRVARRRTQIREQPGSVVLASAGAELIGFANSGPSREPEPPTALELRAIYLRAAWWSTGVGHALLEAALGDADATLWVLEGNERAIGFYRRHGFVPDGTTKTDDVRQLRMVRRTSSAADSAADPG